jgi:hypothetical protein
MSRHHSGIPSGSYTIIVELIVPGMNTPPSSSREIPFTAPQPTPRPLLENLVSQISENPPTIICLSAVALALLAVLIWLLIQNRRQAAQNDSTLGNRPLPPTGKVEIYDDRTGYWEPVLLPSGGQSAPSQPARLKLIGSPKRGISSEVVITHQPFTIGRTGNNRGERKDFDLTGDSIVAQCPISHSRQRARRNLILLISARGTVPSLTMVPAAICAVDNHNGERIRFGASEFEFVCLIVEGFNRPAGQRNRFRQIDGRQ